MSTMHHPTFPDVIVEVPAEDADSYSEQGWLKSRPKRFADQPAPPPPVEAPVTT